MRYLFNDKLLLAIQTAFKSATVNSDLIEQSAPDKRDYFFIEFKTHPLMVFDDNPETGSVNVILSGDKKLSEYCNAVLNSIAKIELGFRWTGNCDREKQIKFMGFCIKIIYEDLKVHLRPTVINQLCDVFKKSELVAVDHDLSQQFFSDVTPKLFHHNFFKRLPRARTISDATITLAKEYIQEKITPMKPAYVRPNELGINPAYQDASIVCELLQSNQKKIWLFRSDFILAIGNKNAYWTSFSETGLPEVISPTLHQHVNWEDRYGHPSLAPEHPGYDSSAFYGGLLAQRNDYLEVYNSSGRYYRNDLSEENKKIIEAYLACQLQRTYGEQKIIFVDSPSYLDYFECALFYHDEALPSYCTRREYDAEKIAFIFQELMEENSKKEALGLLLSQR